jgi:O-antigen/teichoic acid export membrane protein
MRVIRKAIHTLSFRLASLCIGVGVTVFLARALDPRDLGRYSILMVIIGIISSLFGSVYAGIAYLLSKQRKGIITLTPNIIALIILITPIIILFSLFLNLFLGINTSHILRILLGFGLIAYIVQICFTGYFLGMGKNLEYNLTQILPQLLSPVFLIIAVQFARLGFSGTIIAWSISQLLTSVYLTAKYNNLLHFPNKNNISKDIVSTLIHFDVQVGFASLINLLCFRGTLILVSVILGMEATAHIGLAITIAEPIYLISISLAIASYDKIGKMPMVESSTLVASLIRASLWLTGGAVLFLQLFAPLVPLIFGKKYEASIIPLRIILLGVIVYGSKDLFAAFFTNQLGRPGILARANLLAMIVSLGSGLILIPRIGLIGGAVVNMLAYFLVFGFLCYEFIRCTGLKVACLIIPTRTDFGRAQEIVRRAYSFIRGIS